VSAADHRTVGELLADSDELARETLLDATPDHAPAMVRSRNQLVGSAAELWAILPSTPDSPSELDPTERLRAMKLPKPIRERPQYRHECPHTRTGQQQIASSPRRLKGAGKRPKEGHA
jgi:hypothetical protein